MNRYDLRKLAKIRLKEAQILLKNGNYDGAYYLSGYVVECGLKACIAKGTKKAPRALFAKTCDRTKKIICIDN